MKLEVHQTRDGSVILSVVGDRENSLDLVFAYGALDGDPELKKQSDHAEFIARIINNMENE